MSEAFKLDLVAIQISIVLVVISIGMQAAWTEATFLFRNPPLLFRSIVARNVIVPAAAILMLKLFPFVPPVALTVAVLAATPVPPFLPGSLLKSGSRSCYVMGLLVSQSVLSIILVPLTISIMAGISGKEAQFSAMQAAKIVFRTILVPFAAGMLIGALLHEKRHRAARIVGKTGNILLIIATVPALFMAWNLMTALIGQGVLIALVLLVIIGLGAGHVLGGPDRHDRTALALATASAHPGVAIAIASANFPEYREAVTGSVVLYLLIRSLLVIPYTRWRRRPAVQPGDLHIPAQA